MWNPIKQLFGKSKPATTPVKQPWITLASITAQLTHVVEVERAEFVLLRCIGGGVVLFHWDGSNVVGNYLTFEDLVAHGARGLTQPLDTALYQDLSWATEVKYVYPGTRSVWNKLMDEAKAIRFAYGVPAETLTTLGHAGEKKIVMVGTTQWTREGAMYLGDTLAELEYLNVDVRLLDWVPGLVALDLPFTPAPPMAVNQF
jgi:hypothetical protein